MPMSSTQPLKDDPVSIMPANCSFGDICHKQNIRGLSFVDFFVGESFRSVQYGGPYIIFFKKRIVFSEVVSGGTVSDLLDDNLYALMGDVVDQVE